MILETFDQEKHDEAMKKDWYEAGREDGLKKGQKLERENGIHRLIVSLRKKETPEENIINILQEVYELSAEDAEHYLQSQ